MIERLLGFCRGLTISRAARPGIERLIRTLRQVNANRSAPAARSSTCQFSFSPAPRRFAAAAEGAVSAGVIPIRPSLAMLLAAHILRDGELVILILRPSLWFIMLSSLRFLGGVLVLMMIARVVSLQNSGPIRAYMELGVAAIAGRITWAILQWMGRLYILTDMRVLTLNGIYHVEVFDCPLRKIARTRLVRTTQERLLAVGSIEIIPQDPACPFGLWQTIDHPDEVNEQILATISRAKRPLSGGAIG